MEERRMRGKYNIWPILLILFMALGSFSRAEDETGTQAMPPATVSQGFETDEQPAEIPSLTESVLPSLSRIAISLVIIIGIIYLTVFLLRKLSGNRLGGKKGTTIQIVEQAYLAPKKSVCLLKLADRAVLVGITDTNINLLTELEWDSLRHEATDKNRNIQKGFPGFLNEAASRLFGGRKGKGVERGSAV
jgi:flagellar protein FliO/FliZ